MHKHIIAGKNGTPVAVDEASGEKKALVVATRSLVKYENHLAPFLNSIYGRDMNQNAAYGGTPVRFHDGTDTALKTFSEPTGTKGVEDSTDRYYVGAKSIKWDNGNVGDIVQIADAGTDITVANYTAFTLWINIDKDWIVGDEISLIGYDVGVGDVGNSVNLSDYFDFTTHDVWHYVAIPLADLGLTAGTIDAIRFEISARAGGKSPKFYMDEIILQETGAPISFKVEPDKGFWFYITGFSLFFADAVAGDSANDIHLSYDKILGVTLNNGFKYERFSGGVIIQEVTSKDLGDILQQPQTCICAQGSDDTNTFIVIEARFSEPLILKSEHVDRLQFTIQDDMSQFLRFRILGDGYLEERI